MENKQQENEGGFNQELSELKKEIELEKQRLQHIEEEEMLEKQEIQRLDERVQKLEHEHPREKEVKLIFIVNTQPVEIEAHFDWKLEEAVKLALKKSGNDNRPIGDWTVKRGDTVLDLATRIRDYHFKECEELYVSLDAGHGGDLVKNSLLCR